jgi:hypothetical protein
LKVVGEISQLNQPANTSFIISRIKRGYLFLSCLFF